MRVGDRNHTAADTHSRHGSGELGPIEFLQARIAADCYARRAGEEDQPATGDAPDWRRVAAAGIRLLAGCAHLLRLREHGAVQAAQILDQQAQLVFVVTLDKVRLGAAQGIVERPELGFNSCHGLDEDPPSVGWIGHTLDVAGLLQPVDHTRRRSSRESGQLCEPSNREPAFDEKPIEAFDVGSGQAQTLGYGQAEQCRLAADLPRDLQDVGPEFGPWIIT